MKTAIVLFFSVDGDHDTLVPKLLGTLPNQIGIGDCAGVDANLISAGFEHLVHVLDRANAATDCKGDENLICDSPHHIHHGITRLMRRRNIQKNKLITALLIINFRRLSRVADIRQIDEINALDHAPILNIQTRNNAFC